MSDVTLEVGTQICFADHAGDFSPAAANSLEQGAPTDVEMELLNLADDAARESDKFDFGANRAARYSCMACLEWQVAAPATGTTVDFFIGFSPDVTALNGNPGYLTGSDAAYAGGPATVDEGLAQLEYIGSMILSADVEFQIAYIGTLVPRERYGILVTVNRGGQVLCDTDDIETHTVLTPIIDDVA